MFQFFLFQSFIPTNAQTPGSTSSSSSSAAAPAKSPTAIDRIKDEGMNRSQVMRTLDYLTNGIGARLTASPSMKRANEWTRDEMTRYGLANAHLESWGPFGRGWTMKSFAAQVTEPQPFQLIAYPKAWSPGTNGTLTGEVIYLDAKIESDLEKYKGKLKGAIVLTSPVRELKALFDAPASRLSEKALLDLANAPASEGNQPQFTGMPNAQQLAALPPALRERIERFMLNQKFNNAKTKFLYDEGAALLVDASRSGDGGTVFVQSASVPPQPPDTPAARRISAWSKDAPRIIPQIVAASEDYNRLARMISLGMKPKMSVNLAVEFHDADLMGYNTIAEIPGTDLKDEIVMLGGHLDSWHAGTGATDNAAGCAVAMEAVRILKALNLQPRRTIRVALWSGEEQGLYGSRAYVRDHFGSFGEGEQRRVLSKKPDYEKLSAYYNLDNGTGKIRGIYMQGNEQVRQIFRNWLAPFKDMGASVLSASDTGGTDHLSFDAIGLPGFQFIQDEIEYDTRTHHSNMDVYDRIQADDMKQAAMVMAAFVYNTAMMDEKLPRKTVKTE